MSNDRADHAANAAGYRARAADCEAAVRAGTPEQGRDARKSQRALTMLADNEDWLAKNSDKLA
jgi:hypothetical protein